jgi:ABC-type proline/glycine betaine transport system permease subunit
MATEKGEKWYLLTEKQKQSYFALAASEREVTDGLILHSDSVDSLEQMYANPLSSNSTYYSLAAAKYIRHNTSIGLECFALGPLIIVWFKYGVFPNTLMAFSIAVFPILLTTARGLREIEPDLLDLVRSLRGSRWQLFTKIQLPGALPYIFAGMKVAAILAVAGAIVGEFLGSDRGLGYLMLQVQVTLDTPAMFMAVILITLLGMALYGLVLLLERLMVVKDARVAG